MDRSSLIARDREKLISLLTPSAPKGASYALLDFPDHSNVGDSAIWLGEVALLREITSRAPSYNCSAYNYDRAAMKASLPAGATVFLHGGGNFGDVWPRHHEFREQMLEEWQDHPVVQLPQSIKFHDAKAIDRTAKLFKQHPSVRLLVRDHASAAFAREHLIDTPELSPDAAFGMGALSRNRPISHSLVSLLRTDKETMSHDLSSVDEVANSPQVDWLEEPGVFRRIATAQALAQALLGGKWSAQERQFMIYMMKASGRLDRGMTLLSEGRRVLTDRLHAHILSLMADIPHVVLDNNYGKIHGYIDTFTKDYDHVFKASSITDVDRILKTELALSA